MIKNGMMATEFINVTPNTLAKNMDRFNHSTD
jgi:hypothetical protein